MSGKGLAQFTTKYSKDVDDYTTDKETRAAMKNLSSLNQYMTQEVSFWSLSWVPITIHIDMTQVNGRVQAYTMTFNESTRSWGDLVKQERLGRAR